MTRFVRWKSGLPSTQQCRNHYIFITYSCNRTTRERCNERMISLTNKTKEKFEFWLILFCKSSVPLGLCSILVIIECSACKAFRKNILQIIKHQLFTYRKYPQGKVKLLWQKFLKVLSVILTERTRQIL